MILRTHIDSARHQVVVAVIDSAATPDLVALSCAVNAFPVLQSYKARSNLTTDKLSSVCFSSLYTCKLNGKLRASKKNALVYR